MKRRDITYMKKQAKKHYNYIKIKKLKEKLKML